jgi:SAM-dependent methyltransferase
MKRIDGDESYRLKKMASYATGRKVLDIGSTEVPNPYLKADHLVGFDLKIGKKSDNYNRVVQGDVFDLPDALDGEQFDCIVVGEVLEHVENASLFLRKCASVLHPGGKIILSTPNPHSPMEMLLTLLMNRSFFYDSEHVMLYPQRWLQRIMESSGFENVTLHSGGMIFPFLSYKVGFPFTGLIPFPRLFCYQTIVCAYKPK